MTQTLTNPHSQTCPNMAAIISAAVKDDDDDDDDDEDTKSAPDDDDDDEDYHDVNIPDLKDFSPVPQCNVFGYDAHTDEYI